MIVNGKNYTAVWMENSKIKMVDQKILPFEFKIVRTTTWQQTAQKIKDMTVRGAGSIGATAAFAMVQAVQKSNEKNHKKNSLIAAAAIKSTRPTAHDLFFAVDSVFEQIQQSNSFTDAKKNARQKANEIFDSYLYSGKKIAEHGSQLIDKNAKILTHCNAGWLALVDWGSATAPIYLAKRQQKNPFVFVDETRPRGQGRLTAWEMLHEKIPHAMIADNAAGHFMKSKEIDFVITGADRIALNGDIANKIGTYEKAVLAKENGIPFFVAAPLTTFDINTESGEQIKIEERNSDEVLFVQGVVGKKIVKAKIVFGDTPAKNPAFDVTPAKYISGIITPKGIIKPNENSIKGILK